MPHKYILDHIRFSLPGVVPYIAHRRKRGKNEIKHQRPYLDRGANLILMITCAAGRPPETHGHLLKSVTSCMELEAVYVHECERDHTAGGAKIASFGTMTWAAIRKYA